MAVDQDQRTDLGDAEVARTRHHMVQIDRSRLAPGVAAGVEHHAKAVAATNPFDSWVPERDALVLLVDEQRLFVLPSANLGTIVPPARLRTVDWSRVALEHDLGPLLGLPPVGAGASRVFKAGPRLVVFGQRLAEDGPAWPGRSHRVG